LKFESFNIHAVLSNRHYLTASEGKEFDNNEALMRDPKEQLAFQREALNTKLGLDLAAKLGIDTGDIVSAEDLEVLPVPQSEDLKGNLSSREANRAKRKARQGGRQKTRDVTSESDNSPSCKKKIKGETDDNVFVESIPDSAGTWPTSAQNWPFESFCELLVSKLQSPSWEIRHGMGTALRELIQVHGRGAGRSIHQTAAEMKSDHSIWLEDIALRLLCVLALDRFGDFISDQVIAPVRETTAQAVGSLAKLMDFNQTRDVVKVLLQLLEQPEWETRHGGLLGLKYLMAARQDLSQELLPLVYPCLYAGLKDGVDDVSAVAAAALVPLAETLVSFLPLEKVETLLETLWDSLLELDELTASTSSILTLLSSLMANPHTECLQNLPLNNFVSRLFPFLCHSSTKVRRSTLKTLETMLTTAQSSDWIEPLASDLLRHVFQRALLEYHDEMIPQIQQLWTILIRRLPLAVLLPSACPCVATWICLVMQSSRVPFDPAALIFPPDSKRRGVAVDEASLAETKYFIAGSDHVHDSPQQRETCVTRARYLAASMLGVLSQYLVQSMPGLTYTPQMETPVECYSKLLLMHLNSRSSIQRTVVAMVMAEWAERETAVPSPFLLERLHFCLTEFVYYDEIGVAYTRLLHETKDFIATLKHYKLDVEAVYPLAANSFLTTEQIQQLAGPVAVQLITTAKLKSKVAEMLDERRKSLAATALQVGTDQNTLNNSTQAALARAVVAFQVLTDKLNPVIKPLMDSIKLEENEQIQLSSAGTLSRLLELCQSRTPCPNQKILKNVCTSLCADVEVTPKIVDGELDGILTLVQQQRAAEKVTSATKRSGPVDVNESGSRALHVQRRGAAMVLKSIGSHFGPDLPTKVSYIWDTIMNTMAAAKLDYPHAPDDPDRLAKGENLIQCLQILEVMSSSSHPSLHGQLLDLLPTLCNLLQHPFRAVRHLASRCMAALGSIDSDRVLSVAVATGT